MRNIYINLAANAPQNTGGGSSHSSTVVTPVWKGSRPTISRRSTDSQSQDHRNHTPISKALKYAAMILMALTLGIGQMWADETFTFSWTTAGVTGYCYSQNGPTGGALITNNAVYFISSSTDNSSKAPTVETISKNAYLNPQKTGFVFKPISDVTLSALVQTNDASRSCTIYVDSVSDSYAYAMYSGAGSAVSKQDMCAYILANAADDTEKQWWLDGTNGKSIKKSGSSYQAGTDSGAKKWLSGEQDPGDKNGFVKRLGSSITSDLSGSDERTLSVKTGTNPFVFKAGKVYRVNFLFSSNQKQALKSFTFSSASSCSAPTSPTNGASTNNSRVVSWTAPGSAPAGGYLVAYSSATSTAPGDAVQAAGTNGNYTVVAVAAGTTTATLSALSASTTYNWWVRSKCGDSSFSSWVAGTAFTTDAPPCGSTEQAALTLSSSSGTICGTGTTTFTVSGGSGTGALSVATSDPSKATASIDGSTVTVTGVAAGSATITVTKACDATYAEKSATFSATVAAIPTANAGADKTTEPETGVALAADAAADGCTGAWTIVSGPNTSTDQLSSTSSATATFTPTAAGTYTLRWTVTNSTSSCSAYDEMTVTAATCAISSCGNATLTYPINVSESTTTSNLVSGATPTGTGIAVGATSFVGIEVNNGSTNNVAATNSCFDTKFTMSGKLEQNQSESYSSEKYLQFAFTVNSGYTFTPCDIQFVVQPVSATMNFRWEVTNGTNLYGYGTGSAGKGSEAGATVLTGLGSTAEMAAGNYSIRLYPYSNVSNTFRIGKDVILKGTTAEACSAPTNAAISGEAEYTEGDNISLTASADGATSATFTWYKGADWATASAGSSIGSGATFTKNSCVEGDAGTYWCEISNGTGCEVQVSKTITVAEYVDPTTKRIYMKCGSTWCDASPKFFAHSWGSVESDVEMTLIGGCETDTYYGDIPAGNTTVIFTRQKNTTTEIIWEGDDFWGRSQDITIGENDLFTCTGWNSENPAKGTFSAGTYATPTYTISFAGNGNTDGEMSAIGGLACGADQAITANAFVKAGYSFTGWVADVDVTVGESTITAGNLINDEVTLKNITSNIALTAQWTQEIPTSVAIGGSWKYFPGQTITLTATPTGGTSDFTYQWQKYVTSAWEDIDGETAATYSKANCTISDCGSYRCVVSKLGASIQSDGYDVHIYTLYGNYDGSDWVSNDLTLVSGTTGQVELSLEAGRLYEFKVKDNFYNYWFGNANYMLKSTESALTCAKDGNDIRVFTGAEGTYTFTVDINHAGDNYVEVSVAYPSVTHPIAGFVYYDKGSNDWDNVAAHWWKSANSEAFTEWNSDPWLTQSVEICGKTYYYMPKLEGYDRLIIHKAGESGSGNQTAEITVDASSSGRYILENSAEWHEFPVYTVTFNSNGGSAVAEQHVGCGGKATLPDPAPTRLNYDFEGWQLNGVDYNFATVVDDDITLDAVWTRKAIPGSEEEEAYVADLEHAKETPVAPPYTGTAFDLAKTTGSCTIEKDKSDATNTADSKTYSYAFLPSNQSSEGQCFSLTAKKAISSLVIYYTLTDGKFTTDDQSKSGSFTYKINSGSAVTGESGNKANTTAYKQTISNIAKDDVVKLYASSNRLAIFGIYATYTAEAPTVKLKVNGVVTQTISITVGEKLGEIFASGSLPTPVLPEGYTFKGWKNEADDEDVDNNTVTTGSMVIYADVDAPASTDATLSALTVNGDAATVNPLDATQYTFTLPFGTFAAPTVVATPTDVKAVATVTANTLSGATIEVVPETGEDDKVTYTITYSIVPSKDIVLVYKTNESTCAGTASSIAQASAFSTYIALEAGTESSTSVNTTATTNGMITISAKPGYAIKAMSFYGKVEDGSCGISLDGADATTLELDPQQTGDACYTDVFTNAEVHSFSIINTGTHGVWVRNMKLTMIQACTPKTIAWTTAPASEYEVGKAGYAIAASANNGTVTYAASNAAITVNESTGALTINSLTNDIDLSASVAAGDGVTYCATPASVVKEEIKTYYLVTFDAQNETAATPVKYYSGDAAIALPSPSYPGFVFQGWFDAETGGTQITEAITPTASRTVYAQWEAQCAGPTITAQPASANYFVGRTASALSCEATPGVDGKALTYTWYSCDDAERTNPVELAGAPTPSTVAVGTFYYYCAVTEADCDVVKTSNVATITVTEKDKVCLVKADLQAGEKNASISAKTGSYKDDANIAINIAKDLKIGGTGNYVKLGVTGTSFANGDEVVITLVDGSAIPAWLQVFAGEGTDLLAERKSGVTAGANTLSISDVPANQKVLYLYRTSDAGGNMNPYVQSMAVYRACPAPILEGISFNSTDAEADELEENTFNVELTNGTNLASMEVVHNVMWVGAHAKTPYTILTNEGAWAWGENTYRVMDKDGDYTDYTINLTEALPDAEEPVIATDLTDHAYCAGEIPELDATANEVSDGGTLTYQWYNADGLIEGATNAKYTPSGEGSYYCKVTNTLAEHRPITTTSATAVLTQKAATSISGTTSFDVEQGATVKFKPTITGANATYAWYACDAEGNHDGDALGTDASYTTSALNEVGASYYVLEVTADCGNESQIFTVNVAELGKDLVAHTPGHYYGQTLKEYNGRSYEIYGFASSSSSSNFLWAGAPTTSSTDENCVLAFNKSGEITWLTNSINGTGSSYSSITNADQFNNGSCSGYKMHYRSAHSLILKVKGYDQFSMYSKDNSASSGNEKFLEVSIDGVLVKSTANTSWAVHNFDLTDGEHVIVVRGNVNSSGSNNEFSQFSLRLPVVAKVDETDYLFVQDAIDAASAPVTITMLGNSCEDVVVADGKNVTIAGGGYALNSLTVQNGGKVNASSALTVVENLYLEAQAGASGQVLGATNVTANAVYMDIRFFEGAETLDAETANRWYMISAPFDVNLADGFSLPDGTPMVFGQTDGENIFDLFEYDGSKRATTGVTGWKRVQGKMKAGRACLIGFNPGQPTTIRLKAASTVLSEPTSIALNEYAGDDANKNWNGVANPTLHYTDLNCDVQTYNNEDGENGRKYIAYSSSSTSFVVGTAFFVQATGTIDLSEATHEELRAPKRNAAERIEYCVRIARSEATAFADQMYVRASETASSEYEQGHDMITWNGTTANTAMIWAENYGKRLAIEEAPLANDKASYQLGIYAPVAGEYRIEVASPREDATLYLTKNGRIYWNLTMGACELDLNQGRNNEYGLILHAEAPAVTTGLENGGLIHGENGVQKLLLDDQVFILRGEKMYDVTGKMVK